MLKIQHKKVFLCVTALNFFADIAKWIKKYFYKWKYFLHTTIFLDKHSILSILKKNILSLSSLFMNLWIQLWKCGVHCWNGIPFLDICLNSNFFWLIVNKKNCLVIILLMCSKLQKMKCERPIVIIIFLNKL